MVKFIINRPIATIMVFLAFIILSIVTTRMLPISLMPDIDIPELNVRVSYSRVSARELENNVIKPLRLQLAQLNYLESIQSVTRNGEAKIRLRFSHKANMDYTFIEANEKVDRLMGSFPHDMERPGLIRARAIDIPILKLNITYKDTSAIDDMRLANLSEFTGQVIKKRLEQIQEVAMVDVTGLVYKELVISPSPEKLESYNLQLSDIEESILSHQIEPGNLLIVDGYFQYHVKIKNKLESENDIREIRIKAGEKIIKLSDVATIETNLRNRNGIVLLGNKQAISCAIIKQADARIDNLKESISKLVTLFESDYPELKFTISEDQSQLLNYAIKNLRQSLIYGILLAFMVLFFFLRDNKSPWLMGIAVPVSLFISLLLFFLLKISINIISLSGLVLGIGMMIDNSIIVIDNISQYKTKNETLTQSCVKGTNEVFRPMLSSVLTTCAVFVPMVFISGISGALFYDQAMAVGIGLLVSLAVSITLLPTLYKLFYTGEINNTNVRKKYKFENVYEKGLHLVFRNQMVSWSLFILLILMGWVISNKLPISKFPELNQTSYSFHICWNENINLQENEKRVLELLELADNMDSAFHTSYIGEQQWIMGYSDQLSFEEALMNFEFSNYTSQVKVINIISEHIKKKYPKAVIDIKASENLFEKIFQTGVHPLEIRLYSANTSTLLMEKRIKAIEEGLNLAGESPFYSTTTKGSFIVFEIEPEIALIYNLKLDDIIKQIKILLNQYELFTLQNNRFAIPVKIGYHNKSVEDLLLKGYVENSVGENISLMSLLKTKIIKSDKEIFADESGEYSGFYYKSEPENILDVIKLG